MKPCLGSGCVTFWSDVNRFIHRSWLAYGERNASVCGVCVFLSRTDKPDLTAAEHRRIQSEQRDRRSDEPADITDFSSLQLKTNATEKFQLLPTSCWSPRSTAAGHTQGHTYEIYLYIYAYIHIYAYVHISSGFYPVNTHCYHDKPHDGSFLTFMNISQYSLAISRNTWV